MDCLSAENDTSCFQFYSNPKLMPLWDCCLVLCIFLFANFANFFAYFYYLPVVVVYILYTYVVVYILYIYVVYMLYITKFQNYIQYFSTLINFTFLEVLSLLSCPSVPWSYFPWQSLSYTLFFHPLLYIHVVTAQALWIEVLVCLFLNFLCIEIHVFFLLGIGKVWIMCDFICILHW